MPNKALAGGLAGGVTIILAWILDTFVHVEIPAEVATAFTTLLSTVAVYLVPHEVA